MYITIVANEHHLELALLGELIESLPKLQVFFSCSCQFSLCLLKLASCFSESFDGFFVDFPNTNGNPLVENEALSFLGIYGQNFVPPTNFTSRQRRRIMSKPASSCSLPPRKTSRAKVVKIIIASNKWSEACGTAPKGLMCWGPKAHNVNGISIKKRVVMAREM